jgi:hypothetical protein
MKKNPERQISTLDEERKDLHTAPRTIRVRGAKNP